MNAKLRAIIVDDEAHARENLDMMLKDHCPEVEVVALARNPKNAHELLEEYQPDLVFLDIMMPGENGFSFLSAYENRSFEVVFTTAHGEYALKALKEQAIDYLEKPLSVEDLQDAVAKAYDRVELRTTAKVNDDKLKRLLDHSSSSKTVIQTAEGYQFVETKDVVQIEAYDGGSIFYLADGSEVDSTQSLGIYEPKLDSSVFLRIHRSNIINIAHHLRGFKRIDGGVAVLSNMVQVPISRRKLSMFMERLENL